jgi:hypothetical protein
VAKQRRAGSSRFGFGAGVVLIVYGLAAVFGYDILEHLSPSMVTGLTALCFGGLLMLWAVSETFDIVGGETVSMVVGVVVAVVVISSFVHENERRPHPHAIAPHSKVVSR